MHTIFSEKGRTEAKYTSSTSDVATGTQIWMLIMNIKVLDSGFEKWANHVPSVTEVSASFLET